MTSKRNDHRPATTRRSAFILTIFPQGADGVWRGVLETAAGDKHPFASLAALNALLLECGWAELNSAETLISPQSPKQPNIRKNGE